jgi:hypothetical protein
MGNDQPEPKKKENISASGNGRNGHLEKRYKEFQALSELLGRLLGVNGSDPHWEFLSGDPARMKKYRAVVRGAVDHCDSDLLPIIGKLLGIEKGKF